MAEIKDVQINDGVEFDTRGGVNDDDLCVKPLNELRISEEPGDYKQFDELWTLFNQEDTYDWNQ